MDERNIILTGFMGTGKTAVGRLLAQRLDREFVDTDEWIVARDGRAIPIIFAEDGEAAFRQLERAAARELGAQTELVIATGGRLMLDPLNAQALGENGRAFCLTAPPEVILQRVAGDRERPLLNVPDPAARIRTLLAERAEGYGRFPQIDTVSKTAVEVTEEILQCISVT